MKIIESNIQKTITVERQITAIGIATPVADNPSAEVHFTQRAIAASGAEIRSQPDGVMRCSWADLQRIFDGSDQTPTATDLYGLLSTRLHAERDARDAAAAAAAQAAEPTPPA